MGKYFDQKSSDVVFSSFVQISLCLQEMANSAVLGAAYRAKHGLLREASGLHFSDMTDGLQPAILACQPYADSDQVTLASFHNWF